MAYSKQWLVDGVRHMGYTPAAGDALREMPDEFDLEQLQEYGDRHGIARDEVISRMGGSP
jgi:hypothetical protein